VAEALFETAAAKIAQEWHSRSGEAGKQRRRWLERVSYGYLSLTIDNGFSWLFDERIKGFDRGRRGPGLATNPFQRGLLSLFAHDKNRLMGSELRRRFAQRLWYAFRHYVPAPFVTGFLADVWESGGATRATNGDVEPELLEWVILERARDEAPHLRGEYSDELEELVAAVRRILPIVAQVEGRKASKAQRLR